MNKKITLLIFLIILSLSIVGCGKDKVYEFNFSDHAIPGATYSGNINLTTGDAKVIIDHYCVLPDINECGQTHFESNGKLNDSQVKKVSEILEKMDYKDSADLISAVDEILRGEEICGDTSNITCQEDGENVLNYLYENLK